MEWLLAIVLKPFVVFCLFVPAVVARVLVQRKMRDGKLKRFLLTRDVPE